MEIKLENVNYIYNAGLVNEVQALKNISLKIGGSSFIALIGSTGSGKSTLIQLLNGLLRPSSGTIYFDGRNIYEEKKKQNRKEAKIKDRQTLREIRKKVGMVFQYPESQLFEETILLDAAFGPVNTGLSKEEALKKAAEYLKLAGIKEEQFEKSPFELSGGEMRRAAIAGVLAMEPEVLVLDEPTAGLDPKGKKDILELVRKTKEEKGMAVVFVSHNMEEVAEYADRVIVMNRGEILLDEEPRAAFSKAAVLEETGLKAPEATYICSRLGIEGVITVDEAAEAIIRKVKENKTFNV